MTTTNAPFAPDWEALGYPIERWVFELWGESKSAEIAKDIVTEYQRQLAAAGCVVVRREDVETLMKLVPFQGMDSSDEEDEAWERLDDSTSRAKYPPRSWYAAQDTGE